MTVQTAKHLNSHPPLRVLLTRLEIAQSVIRLATELDQDYRDLVASDNPSKSSNSKPELLVVGVLRGAFMFVADLVRSMNISLAVDFLRVDTYGAGTVSSKEPRLVQAPQLPIKGKHIVIVEDIVDTGITTNFVRNYFIEKGAASIKLCTLLSKPSRRVVEVDIDYLGFTIEDVFVVGYGLDYAQQYRNLPDVCILEPSS